jgi:hypothetical protein
MAYAEPTDVSFSAIKPKLSLPPINPKPQPPKLADDTSFDARFTAVWAGAAGATNMLGRR